eukprot:TRINITY_DN6080_c0_g3_i1.p1 TRINITY_DN6080_c0_g3~~TRINITY_DN6080_c0_g3_i1.p1  ORF type:complete len:585 (-),score=172.38 TRINITY_DN6080_c0_g3_i1:194-1765(-)
MEKSFQIHDKDTHMSEEMEKTISENGSLMKQIQELQDRVNEWKNKYEVLLTKSQKYQEEIQQKNNKIQLLTEQTKSQLDELRYLDISKQTIEELKSQIQILKNRSEELRSKMETDYNESLHQKLQEIENLKDHITKIQKELEVSKEQLKNDENYEKEILKLNNEITDIQAELSYLNKKTEEDAKTISNLNAKILQLTQANENLEKKNQDKNNSDSDEAKRKSNQAQPTVPRQSKSPTTNSTTPNPPKSPKSNSKTPKTQQKPRIPSSKSTASLQTKNTATSTNLNINEQAYTISQFFPKIKDNNVVADDSTDVLTTSKRKREDDVTPSITKKPHLSSPTVSEEHSDEKPVVWLTGLKESKKQELKDIILSLGGDLREDSKFDQSITHIVCPSNTHTIKSLVGFVTGKWVVGPGWLEDSKTAKKFISPQPYGKCGKSSPFEGKTFYLSPSFLSSNPVSSETYNNFIILLETLGGGTRKESGKNVDFVILASTDKESPGAYGQAKLLTYSSLIDLVNSNIVEIKS